ncbi:MAG: winged helix-turn-helix domain-containing protein [Thermoproteota archaeon]
MENEMRSRKIEEYSRQIPDEVKFAIRGLDHDVRYGILVCLLRNGGRLSFAELQEKLNISKGRLAYHLGLLMDGALVRNFSEMGLKDRYNSYYEVTGFAIDFLETLFRFIILPASEQISIAPLGKTESPFKMVPATSYVHLAVTASGQSREIMFQSRLEALKLGEERNVSP